MNEPQTVLRNSRGAGEMALIYAAERLFAEHGIAGVSLRQINQAANQKNISAAHYHFGSRDGLASAVLQHRWLDLDHRRRDRLASAGREESLGFYVQVMIETLAEELRPRPEGNHYLRFIHQYEQYKGGREAARSMSPAGVEIYDRIEDMVPEPVRRVRMRYLVDMVHSVLATAERQLENMELTHEDISLITSNLVDMMVAALSTPISSTTTARLSAASGGA